MRPLTTLLLRCCGWLGKPDPSQGVLCRGKDMPCPSPKVRTFVVVSNGHGMSLPLHPVSPFGDVFLTDDAGVLLAVVGGFQFGDVEFGHLHHRLHRALRTGGV